MKAIWVLLGLGLRIGVLVWAARDGASWGVLAAIVLLMLQAEWIVVQQMRARGDLVALTGWLRDIAGYQRTFAETTVTTMQQLSDAQIASVKARLAEDVRRWPTRGTH